MEVTSSRANETLKLTFSGLSRSNKGAFAKARQPLSPSLRLIEPQAFIAIWPVPHRYEGQVHSKPRLLVDIHQCPLISIGLRSSTSDDRNKACLHRVDPCEAQYGVEV